MKKFILDGKTLKTIYELDSNTGSVRPAKSPVVNGSGRILRIDGHKKIVAVFADDNNLYLQIGEKSWNINKNGISFSNEIMPLTFKLFRKFVASTSDGKTIFSVTYLDRFWFHWKNWIDITYDEFDRELDDIFLWLSRDVNDAKWRRELAIKWSAGIASPP